MIRAQATADEDSSILVLFDAEPWFENATAQQLSSLAANDYSNCELADAVLHWTEAFTERRGEKRDIKRFFKHIGASDYGYEVYIEEKDVNLWLWKRHTKPSLDAVDYLLGQ